MEIDESGEYRNWLQKSLLTEGWESYFDFETVKSWVKENREQLRIDAQTSLGAFAKSQEDCFADLFENFEPDGRFDLPTTEAIFRPLFDEITHSAKIIGLKPIRDVELVTSTSILPTAFGRSTNDTHQLFVGPGTSAFCNYWSKAFTAIFIGISKNGYSTKISSAEDFRKSLPRDPSGLFLASRLSLYYAAAGTLIGFGKVPQSSEYPFGNVELLHAMEQFVLAHEYTHFLLDERNLGVLDADGKASNHEMEFLCDLMGFQISRHWGAITQNWMAYTGMGAIAFFTAINIGEKCKTILAGTGVVPDSLSKASNQLSDSHPPLKQRIDRLIDQAIDKTPEDQRPAVKSYLDEVLIIFSALTDIILEVLREGVDLSIDEMAAME